jgi:hypothetical protein
MQERDELRSRSERTQFVCEEKIARLGHRRRGLRGDGVPEALELATRRRVVRAESRRA